jgi:hypothetical protein
MENDDEHILGQLRLAADADRGYASFWKWALDRTIEEAEVARVLLRFLKETEQADAAPLQPLHPNDPPDCKVILTDGRCLGIEVTELVDQTIVEHHARAKHRRRKKASEVPELDFTIAEWTPSSLASAIHERVRRKDIPPEQRNGGPYTSYIVAMPTDETFVTYDLAKQVLDATVFEVRWVDRAFLMLSYHPAYVERFPEGYPILEIKLDRRGNR